MVGCGVSNQWGLMVDNVLELEVVTGTGDLLVCSPRRNRRLFELVRGGLGQFGIIVRARVALRDVPPMARVYKLLYRDIARFTADQEMLVAQERFDYVEGDIFRAEDGQAWVFRLEATTYFEPGEPPDDARILQGLSFEPGSADIQTMGYLDFIYRLDPVVEMLKNLGLWSMPHPWLNLFLPADTAPWLVQRVLERTPAEDMGGGPILFYPFKKSAVHARYPVLPPGDTCYLFSLLRTAVPGTPDNTARLVAENRAVFELARAHGATVYPISAVPLTHWDWRFHFWPWFDFLSAKRRFDPNLILTPGQNIFAR